MVIQTELFPESYIEDRIEAFLLEDPKNKKGNLRVSTDLGEFYVDGYRHKAHIKKNVDISEFEERLETDEFHDCIRSTSHGRVEHRLDGMIFDIPLNLWGVRFYTLGQVKHFLSNHPDLRDQTDEDRQRLPQKVVDVLDRYPKIQQAGGLQALASRMVDYMVENKPDVSRAFNLKDLIAHAKAKPGVGNVHYPLIDHIFSLLQKGHPLQDAGYQDSTRKVSIPSPLPKELFTQGGAKQARWRLAPASSFISIDQGVKNLLDKKSYFDTKLADCHEFILNRHSKVIEEEFSYYDGTNFGEIEIEIGKRMPKGGKYINAIRQAIDDRHQLAIEMLGYYPKIRANNAEFRLNFNDKKFDLHFHEDILAERRIGYKRMRTTEEVFASNYAVLDTEQPLYADEDWTTSWVSILAYKNGKSLEKTIFTLHSTTKDEIKGNRVILCKDELELVAQVRDYITGNDLDTVVAYNTPHDLIKLREGGKFEFEGKRPVKKATQKFFERIGIDGLEVIDPLRWAKSQLKYLKNQKLVMVSQELASLEEETGSEDEESQGLIKSINYAQQGELEKVCYTGDHTHLDEARHLVAERFGDVFPLFCETYDRFKKNSEDLLVAYHIGAIQVLPDLVSNLVQLNILGDIFKRTCGDMIAEYVAGDTDALPDILDHRLFRNGLEDLCEISSIFKIDIPRLMHNPSAVLDYHEKTFQESTGMNLDAMVSKTSSFKKYLDKSKAKFTKINEARLPKPKKYSQGVVEDIHRVYVSKGRLFRHIVLNLFGEDAGPVEEFYKHVDQHDNDQLRSFFLAQYEDALFEVVLRDYASVIFEEDKLAKMYRRYGKHGQGKWRKRSVNEHKFLQSTLQIRDEAYNRLSEGNDDYIDHLRRHNMTKKLLKELWPELEQSLDNTQLREMCVEGFSDYQNLFNQWSRVESKRRLIAGKYKEESDWVTAQLDIAYEGIQKFFDNGNGFDIVHVEGDYVYVRGDKDNLKDLPEGMIPVEHIDRAFITHSPDTKERRNKQEKLNIKIYYEQHGWVNGLTDHGYALCPFEQAIYAPFILGLLSEPQELKRHLDEPLHNLAMQLDMLCNLTLQPPTSLQSLLDNIEQFKQQSIFTAAQEKPETPDDDPRQFLYYSKSSDTYNGFTPGFDRKIYFRDLDIQEDDSGKHVEVEGERHEIKQSRGLSYYEEDGRKRYIIDPDRFKPDYSRYREQILARVTPMLDAILLGNGMGEHLEFKDVGERFASHVANYAGSLDKPPREVVKKIREILFN